MCVCGCVYVVCTASRCEGINIFKIDPRMQVRGAGLRRPSTLVLSTTRMRLHHPHKSQFHTQLQTIHFYIRYDSSTQKEKTKFN